MNPKLFFLLLFLSLTYHLAYSQQIFTPGYLVGIGGDTTKGYVLDASYDRLSRECPFKSSLDAPVRTYLPQELAAFGTDEGDHYRSHFVTYTSKVKNTVFEKRYEEQRFLRLLEGGTIELYKLQNTETDYVLYLSKNKEPLQKLVMVVQTFDNLAAKNKKILTSDTVTYAPTVIQGAYNFRRLYYLQLQDKFADCPNAVPKQWPELEQSAVKSLIAKYNKKCGTQLVQKSKNKGGNVLSLVFGANSGPKGINNSSDGFLPSLNANGPFYAL